MPTMPQIPGYRDVRLHRRGSSADVYRATMEHLDNTVAIKLLRLDDLTTYQQFQQELDTAVQLSRQPHVVPILDTGVIGDRPYLTMEFCEDGSYAEIVSTYGPLSIRDVVDVGTKIAEALHAAHEMGFIHRDVTPANVMRSASGPALTDFGIARKPAELTGTVTLNKLTPHHAAPEALQRQPQSVQSDIYSLASTLWFLLAGYPPFAQRGERNPDPFTYRERVLSRPAPLVPRPDVPVWLQTEIARAMSKRVTDRHATAKGLADALRHGWLVWSGQPWEPPTAYRPLTELGDGEPGGEPATPRPGSPAGPAIPGTPVGPGLTFGPAGSPAAPTGFPTGIAGSPLAPTGGPLDAPGSAPPHPVSPASSTPHLVSGGPAVSSGGPAVSGGPSVASAPPTGHQAWMRPTSGGGYQPAPYEGFAGTPTSGAAVPTSGASAPPYPPGHEPLGHEPAGEEPRRMTGRVLLATGVMGVLLGVLVVAVLRLLPGDPPRSAEPSAPAGSPTASVVVDRRPTDVAIDDRGSSVTITWKDHTDGTAPHYVVGGPENASPQAMTQAEKGITEVTIDALNPETDYCFTVIAVISVDEVAPSREVCTERG